MKKTKFAAALMILTAGSVLIAGTANAAVETKAAHGHMPPPPEWREPPHHGPHHPPPPEWRDVPHHGPYHQPPPEWREPPHHGPHHPPPPPPFRGERGVPPRW
ncbi:MAG: hypothetical protein IJG36_10355 [Synergistaceae bacterium]|nr:hypothetical protein [Synergistaceae bacterium]